MSCKGPEKLDTHPIQQTLQFLCTLSATSAFLFFFFDEFFQVDQGRLTFERLDLLVSFRFTEYIRALATRRIAVASFKSIQKLSSLSRL